MREIKFRAWDKNKKVMLYGVTVYDSGNGGIDYDNALEAYGSEENLPDEQGDEWVFLMNHELTQYTGMKDKKGNDIYEGDILKCIADDDYPDSNIISDVLFGHDLQWCVRSIIKDIDPGDVYCGMPLSWGWWKAIVVIGNIYENPELLSKEQNVQGSVATDVDSSTNAGNKK